MAISVDPQQRSKSLAEELSLRFSLLSDESLTVGRQFGVEDAENEIHWPAIYVIGRDGKVRWRSLSETFDVRSTSETLIEALDADPAI